MGWFDRRKTVSTAELADAMTNFVRDPSDAISQAISTSIDVDISPYVRYEWRILSAFLTTWIANRWMDSAGYSELSSVVLDAFHAQVGDDLLLTKFNVDTNDFDLSAVDISRHFTERYQRYYEAFAAGDPEETSQLLAQAVGSFVADGGDRDPGVFMPILLATGPLMSALRSFFEEIS